MFFDLPNIELVNFNYSLYFDESLVDIVEFTLNAWDLLNVLENSLQLVG